MATSVTVPPPLLPVSQKPTAKERKYDRQLRLWAASGQEALENAKILLLNTGAGVVGIETLKNLILPGVGSFTVVDEAVVEEKDLGVNFFLSEDSLGKSRAEECAKFLKELNPEVKGQGIRSASGVSSRWPILLLIRLQSLASFIPEIPDISPTLILLVGPSSCAHALSAYCLTKSIPLFYVHSIGFYSHFSVQIPSQFPIVDTHPDPASTQDLRLLTPWPELVELVQRKTEKIDQLPDHEHGHVPYLLLLLHYLENWREGHDGKAPQNYGEKKEFKSLVEKGARISNPEGREENFDEAAAAVLKSLNPPSITSGLREVFESEDCKTPSAESERFWMIAHAVQKFHAKHELLPLPGTLPDMKAQSADYINLQNTYKKKARQDLAEVISTVRSTEERLKRKAPIDEKEVEAFCKGAAFVKLIRGRPLRFAQIHDKKTQRGMMDWSDSAKGLALELQMPEESSLPIYIAFLAYDHIQIHTATPSSEPSTSGESFNQAADYASSLLTQLAKQAGLLDEVDLQPLITQAENVLKEFERAEDAAELHNISALTGGMVAQEVIKVVTKQYIPVDNACVFDGIVSKTAVFRM